jgi:hypothetical protein
MTLIKHSKTYDRSISNAYNLLVSFRKIIEEHPNITSYMPEEIEEIYKNLWCDAFPNRDVPWK